MRILVTGGCGFIGSAVIRLAIKQGHSIINIDSLSYASSLSNLEAITYHKNYSFEHTDIRNRSDLDDIFKKHEPEVVMHLAAESHVDRSIKDPIDFIETNITGTFHLLEASREYWIKKGSPSNFRFHHISTDEVFGSLPPDPNIKFTEETAYDPRSPYSASKASSDHLVRAWHKTYNLPVIITNCSNNYGPYQHPEKLIPKIIINALSNKSLPIYGDGSNIRDWLFVKDHATALLLTLTNGEVGANYNIGGNNEMSNLDIAQSICTILDELMPRNSPYEELIKFVSDRPGHDARYAIDSQHIYSKLGWQALTNIDQGLKETVEWYLLNEKWWKSLLKLSNN